MAILCDWTEDFTYRCWSLLWQYCLIHSKVVYDVFTACCSYLVSFPSPEPEYIWKYSLAEVGVNRAMIIEELLFQIEGKGFIYQLKAVGFGQWCVCITYPSHWPTLQALKRAISGLLLSFLYIEICATNAISSCSASVHCICFSVDFFNVLYVVFWFWPEEKMFLVNVQDFK